MSKFELLNRFKDVLTSIGAKVKTEKSVVIIKSSDQINLTK